MTGQLLDREKLAVSGIHDKVSGHIIITVGGVGLGDFSKYEHGRKCELVDGLRAALDAAVVDESMEPYEEVRRVRFAHDETKVQRDELLAALRSALKPVQEGHQMTAEAIIKNAIIKAQPKKIDLENRSQGEDPNELD